MAHVQREDTVRDIETRETGTVMMVDIDHPGVAVGVDFGLNRMEWYTKDEADEKLERVDEDQNSKNLGTPRSRLQDVEAP